MNIFQKIKLINKLVKCIEIIKETHYNKEVKYAIIGIKENAEKLVKLLPQLKETYQLILDFLKK